MNGMNVLPLKTTILIMLIGRQVWILENLYLGVASNKPPSKKCSVKCGIILVGEIEREMW